MELPHLPEMVFSQNKLVLTHKNGAKIEFNPLDALSKVRNAGASIQVACADEWRSTRSDANGMKEIKPFDWSFSTDYQGTFNDKIRCEDTDAKLDIFKLMQKEQILFYQDLTLFEDELHDHGIAACSVKIVSIEYCRFKLEEKSHDILYLFQRVMPSGFFILLSYFLRVDGVLIRMNGTRFHYETGNDYMLKEYTSREAKFENLKHVIINFPMKKYHFRILLGNDAFVLFADSTRCLHNAQWSRKTFEYHRKENTKTLF